MIYNCLLITAEQTSKSRIAAQRDRRTSEWHNRRCHKYRCQQQKL